ARSEAVVIIATVDDRCAVLMAAANRQGNQIPGCSPETVVPMVSAIPEFCSTLPKIPPAPVIKIIDAELVNALPTQPSHESMSASSFFGRSNARNTPTSKATKGSPKNISASITTPSVKPVTLIRDLVRISRIGTTTGKTDLNTLGALTRRCCNCSSLNSGHGSMLMRETE